jgi:hypothetical protein
MDFVGTPGEVSRTQLYKVGKKLIDWYCGKAPNGIPTTQNVLITQRYERMVGGPIIGITIDGVKEIRGDVTAALASHSNLRKFKGTSFSTSTKMVPEADWARLCAGLRTLSELEVISLSGEGITDGAISPLAGHPKIHSLYFGTNDLDNGCMATFATMPRLKSLWIVQPDWRERGGFTEAQWTERFASLRTLTGLEELHIGGRLITDAALARLAGHPAIREVFIVKNQLTTGCIPTFSSMPRLSRLVILRPDHTPRFTSDEEVRFVTALPSVTVEFPP